MYYQALWKRIKRNQTVWKLLALFNLAMVSSLIYIFFLYSPSPTKHKIISHSIDRLQKSEQYELKIEENSQVYNLKFVGKAINGQLEGKLEKGENLELRIKSTNETLLIQQEENDWKNASEMGLNQLENLMVLPEKIIHQVKQSDYPLKQGPHKSINGVLCDTFYWKLKDNNLPQALFPGIDQHKNIESRVKAYLTQEKSELVKLNISLVYQNIGEEKTEIKRTLLIN